MKVLLVSEHFPPGFQGGSAVYLEALARGLVRRGHEVHVVAGGRAGAERSNGLVLHRTGVDPAGAGLGVRVAEVIATRARVRALLRAERFDLLHLNHLYAALGASLAAPARTLPVVATFFAPYHLEWRAFRDPAKGGRRGLVPQAAAILGYARWAVTVERGLFRRARRVLALSEYSRAQAIEVFDLPPERVVLVPGGVDGERFRPARDRAETRARLGLPTDRFLLLTVRRLDPRMGVEDFLGAVSLLPRDASSPFLVVAGSGRLEGSLRDLAGRLGIAESVRFAGRVPDATLPDYYRAADLFVLPSRDLEAFGLVTLEALASGLPVLGTNVGGTPEILQPLDPRLLVEGRGAEAIASGIERARREGLCAESFGTRCREYALSRFSWSRAVGALERAYGDAVGA